VALLTVWVAASVVLTAGAHITTLPALAASTAGIFPLYWISLRRRPLVDCGRCAGQAKDRPRHATLWRRAYARRCRRCHNTGSRIRLGVRILMPGRARDLRTSHQGR
jgi:hypothetical protein